jgi:hypothetical protein
MVSTKTEPTFRHQGYPQSLKDTGERVGATENKDTELRGFQSEKELPPATQ